MIICCLLQESLGSVAKNEGESVTAARIPGQIPCLYYIY